MTLTLWSWTVKDFAWHHPALRSTSLTLSDYRGAVGTRAIPLPTFSQTMAASYHPNSHSMLIVPGTKSQSLDGRPHAVNLLADDTESVATMDEQELPSDGQKQTIVIFNKYLTWPRTHPVATLHPFPPSAALFIYACINLGPIIRLIQYIHRVEQVR